MSKLYSSIYIIKILRDHGFIFVSQKGSHAKFKNDGDPTLIVIVPMGKKVIPIGTFKSILKQSKLTSTDFD